MKIHRVDGEANLYINHDDSLRFIKRTICGIDGEIVKEVFVCLETRKTFDAKDIEVEE